MSFRRWVFLGLFAAVMPALLLAALGPFTPMAGAQSAAAAAKPSMPAVK